MLPVALRAQSQTAASYTAAASGSNAAAYATFQPALAAAVRTAGTSDEGYYNALPIGFSFRFAGANYTTVSASTNGWTTFGQNLTNATPTNNLATGTPRPIVAPLWDDISFGTAASPADPTADGNFFYETTGVAASSRPNGVTCGGHRPAGSVLSTMLRLFEGTNVVQFQYLAGPASAAGSGRTASVGIAGAANDYLAASDLNGSASFSSMQGRLARRYSAGAASNVDVNGLAPGVYVLSAQVVGQLAHTARLVVK